MDSISILSLNCQGLGNVQKRRDVFHYWREKKFDILCLQDTHFEKKLEKYITSEWGYQAYFASNNSISRGVAILFNNTFEFKIKKVIRDIYGNYIFITVEMKGEDYLIANIYGPNRDNPEFYERLNTIIKNFSCANIILTGDWNLVLDPSKDYENYKTVNNLKAQEKLLQIINDLNLCDIWREMNPECRRFTWRRARPQQQSRLDYFIISDNIIEKVNEADIVYGYRTDHSGITLKLQFNKNKFKRNNFWKFNTSLLKDKNYLDEINTVIDDVLLEYAALPYDRQNLLNIKKNELEFMISEDLLLDFILMKARTKTISYASNKKKKENEQERKLEEEIDLLEKILDRNEHDNTLLQNKSEELKMLREKRIEGVMIRSKARWVQDGEKVSKYFCSLEKRHYISKTMTKLIGKNGEEIKENNLILETVKQFYESLYEDRKTTECMLEDVVENLPCLNEFESNKLEGEITYDEVCYIVKNMKNMKSPGTDGFNIEFYKAFWGRLGHLVVRALNTSYHVGNLTSTQRQGIITCIPKGDKPKEYVKNWRPISLLNVLYKIGSGCIANRIKGVLPSLINEDQTGFISGRYIGDNIRLIYDLINYLDMKNKPGLLLNIDFEKAFDSLDWNFMHQVLKTFGFGEDIRRWIKLFYTDINSTVLVNGCASSWFKIKRGCRQGDPISPYLFVICAEVLALMIRECKDIKGLVVNGIEHKISQYADDTEFTLDENEKSFEACFNVLEYFGKISGLKVNTDKTSAMWLGSLKNSPKQFMPHLNIAWNPPHMRVLGILLTNSLKECLKLNYDEKFYEVKKLMQAWLKRNITPLGRIMVLKSLILSKLIHLWLLLPRPPENRISELQAMCFKFVWNNKPDKISRKTSVKAVTNGGLGLPDVKTLITALKLTWIRKYKNSSHKWKSIVTEGFTQISQLEIYGPEITNKYVGGNVFWTEVFNAYREFFYKVEIRRLDEILAIPLCFNKNILFGRRPVNKNRWIEQGVCYIGDFIKEEGNFYNAEEFNEKYNVEVDYITYNGIKMAIKKYIRTYGLTIINNKRLLINPQLKKLYSVTKGSKEYYNILLENNCEPKCIKTWESKLSYDVNWKLCFKKIQKCQEVNMKWFKIRIVHRILGTNVILKGMGITPTDLCNFCKKEKDSIVHIFWHCETVKKFWTAVEKWITESCEHTHNLRFSERYIVFNIEPALETDCVIDYIVDLAKKYIYSCKYINTRPILDVFKKKIIWNYKIVRYNAIVSQNLNEFDNTWHFYEPLLA